MFEGHNPYLVVLSVVMAILGGYTGFGLASRVRSTSGIGRRVLLAGAATFVALGIWTMHFVGTLAGPVPSDAVYLILPTLGSFLICTLVVGVSLFLVSVGEPSDARVTAAALFMGAGIVSMHYVGVNAFAGGFRVEHERAMVVLSALIAVGTAYGGLRVFLARQGGTRLALSAIAFGFAVSGMHYTATYGMRFRSAPDFFPPADGLIASSQVLALVLVLLCFLITGGFLLSLVPEPRQRAAEAAAGAIGGYLVVDKGAAESAADEANPAEAGEDRPAETDEAPPAAVFRVPVESANGTQFIDVAEIRAVRADAHYTLVHDGSRERMCLWAISKAEAQLDPALFFRVHRSHIVSLPHVTLIRKEGDGAVVELDGPASPVVPVSRAKIAELKARLGVAGRKARAS
ncbi:MHYT domain-containing protein [Mesorhizobium sp. BAC0120]|uniref:MHYT domain-containing protein n=1 Tax=Mesorhizobium sp. BAC0120 TaxID=3090670 RepID=UPI00298CA72A|nr:MHYT domain-containing protein [Mesorhizobium sp. BAC0120]MDW6025768.1 MHYT domain-containing protein [Mesorhizobium sp. BAC0120]